VRKQNVQESLAWYTDITADMFAKTGPRDQSLGAGGTEPGLVKPDILPPDPPKTDP
jgi:hypothetical protein